MRSLISIALILIYPALAHATSCDAQIARAEVQSRQAQPNVWLPESTAAKLHHQPTQQSLRQADTEAKDELNAALVRARKLNSEGKDSECIATLDKFLLPGVP